MGRHDWAEREADSHLAPAPGRLRLLMGRSAVIVLVIGALCWVSISIFINPLLGAPQQVETVQVDGDEEPNQVPVPMAEPPAAPDSPQPSVRAPAGSGSSPPGSGTSVVIHVIGAVKNPGVYELRLGSRILDAVKKAGGLSKDALPESINLAAEISDGQQIRIPRRGDKASIQTPEPPPGQEAATATGGIGGVTPGAKLNINTATGTELETLPGIGPALAQRIIEFRQSNGPFKNIGELDAVSGIGPSLLATLRAKVGFE